MLELELIPEKSLASDQWEFTLGMHFSQAVMIIQSQVGVIRGVQVIYSDSNPLSKDLEINLSQDGIRLRFDPISQRLKIIEIYNLKLVKLKYSGIVFNSEEVYPTMEQIEHSFGATLPGLYNPNSEMYVVYFRGVSFYFPASKYQSPTGHRPLGSPVAVLVSIHPGSCESNVETPPLPLNFCLGEVYLSGLLLLEDLGLRLHLYTGGTSRPLEGRKETITCQIHLGDMPQEVVSRLGSPGSIFYKSEDKMKIHSVRRLAEAVGRTDYFYNYFSLGIDILFDGRTHEAKKFILHTNYPGHYNFNMYHRCEFLINLPVERGTEHLESPNIQVTAYTKWETICEHLNASPKPVVLNRASSINTKNFFGPTLCYGYRDFIFEVMPNQHIASVTIYRSESVF
ncbi:PHAF1 protein CG7083 isoform X1 [Halyomorpha halys]|uniref:PHAF1 protein CG7083 isoform X1 n=1 Tax=Halyomorpha halys TaxID=286706 RepID=UPI0006D5064A|nr:UPF0183 protein CG7083 isoform X1 [Halyomorpha halys]